MPRDQIKLLQIGSQSVQHHVLDPDIDPVLDRLLNLANVIR
jgi:hypothetical protein